MLLDRVLIENFKSYGNEQNVLDIHPQITSIIGKNGSGKSNIIEVLKLFNPIIKRDISKINKKKNLKMLDNPTNINFQFLFDASESVKYKNSERTIFKLMDNIWHFEGGLFNVINSDEKIISLKNELLELYKKPIFRADMSGRVQILTKNICTFNNEILTNQKRELKEGLNFIKNISEGDKILYAEEIDLMYKVIEQYSKIIPIVFSFDNKVDIKSSYTLDELIKIKENKSKEENRFFSLLIKSLGIKIEDVIFAISSSNSEQSRRKKEKDINKILKKETPLIFENINLNNLELEFQCKDGLLNVYIINDETPVLITDRSDGLKWYLSLYLQMKDYNCLESKTIILIDEPDGSVHIEAQKGIKELFEQLGKTSQIIYTTHSPFMIDTEDLSRLVAVEKVDGISIIHNKIHGAKIHESSKLEILSPLYKAIGYSCRFNIGPKYDKLNIITEGITEYYYLLGFLYYLGVDENNFPNILPSVGVNNIHHIASILIGWGCEFKILLDYDNAGFEEYKKLLKLKLEQDKEIYNVSCLKFKSIEPKKEDSLTIENVLVEIQYQNVDEGDKFLLAKTFYDDAKNGRLILSEDSKANIIKLTKQMGIFN